MMVFARCFPALDLTIFMERISRGQHVDGLICKIVVAHIQLLIDRATGYNDPILGQNFRFGTGQLLALRT